MTSEVNAASSMANNGGNFRNPTINEPRIFGGPYGMQTPIGTVRTSQPPALPPRPFGQQQSGYGLYGAGSMYNNSYYGSPYSYGNGLNSFGGLGGYGGFGSYGGYGGYNRFGSSFGNPMDPENRFIQIAEESSRPAFQSIESLVNAIGNIASMLDSTFFAITSSFRAILGVAANFGRLRGVFAQFWQSFAIFRGLNWLFRKILYWLKVSNLDPSTVAFTEAYTAAQQGINPNIQENEEIMKRNSPWPVLAFIGFIFTAPYLIMKLLGTVSSSALEESKNPTTWVKPMKAVVKYDFRATNQEELSIHSGQTIYIAPKEVQITHKLLNTGWLLATIDNQKSGIIPMNYLQMPRQIVQSNVANIMSNNEIQPKTIDQTTDIATMDADNFPTMSSIMEKSPEEIIHQTYTDNL